MPETPGGGGRIICACRTQVRKWGSTVQKNNVSRVYVERKQEFAGEAARLCQELRDNLGLEGLTGVRILTRYDIEGLPESVYREAGRVVLAEPAVDLVYEEEDFAREIARSEMAGSEERVLAIEYQPGQYDQRGDYTAQCLQVLTGGERPTVRVAKVLVLTGKINGEEMEKIKKYLINPLESREAPLEKPATLAEEFPAAEEVAVVTGFIDAGPEDLERIRGEMDLAMSRESLEFCQQYFRDTARRDPTLTELRILDTYWSDHCRHLTFLTGIKEVEFEEGEYTGFFRRVYQRFLENRRASGKGDGDLTLMELATAVGKEMKEKGLLEDLEVSEEINASSIKVDVTVDGKTEEWLVMFKNETHNHPTEIEPDGGAATCLGGGIRDPLSGRAYVYQAMRVTGSGDPRQPVEKTIPGKLPQRKITTTAAAGYSSYGNQIGVASGLVAEVYDEGFVAKRMEMGAVIGAAPRAHVVRERPVPGDVVILLGGRTGRDGCGGATGSSRAHTEESLYTCGAEVQKGDPLLERRIQRLFRRPEVTRLIKRCNDFGAGGVSVAVGELADGLEINLDAVPAKYAGLDGTELAISESQERMAVVVAKDQAEAFIRAAREENLEATVIAEVTAGRRMRMSWRGKTIVDLDRDFLDSGGVRPTTRVVVKAPQPESYFRQLPPEVDGAGDLATAWLRNLQRLNVCSRRGLVEIFDSTIGAGTVLVPLGGAYQLTPAESMAAKIPVLGGETTTATLMSYGYNPAIGRWSPFHGALYAIVEAVARIAAAGGDYRRIRLSLQEYFERLGEDPAKWGKPFAALLGAYYVQTELGIPAVGGKDSMSGSFEDLHVPPTVVAVAVCPADARRILSPEFKAAGSRVIYLPLGRKEGELPDLRQLAANYGRLYELAGAGKVTAAQTVREGGLAAALSKMAFGNMIGLEFTGETGLEQLFTPAYGSLVLEIPAGEDPAALLAGLEYKELGVTIAEPVIRVNGTEIPLAAAVEKWEEPLAGVFPPLGPGKAGAPVLAPPVPAGGGEQAKATVRLAKPRVFIPVFPGTNGEYDAAAAFERAGGLVETLVIKNLSSQEIDESLRQVAKMIGQAQILVLPGGFSPGNGTAGSARFMAAFLRNTLVKEALNEFLDKGDGLILGIGAGFQALLKLGLLPYGEFREAGEDSPALTLNVSGRHVSRFVQVKVVANNSPWLRRANPGEVYSLPVSHNEGRFIARPADLDRFFANAQIATVYVDPEGNPALHPPYNPNGSAGAVEGLTSPDGRIFGRMAHAERVGPYVAKNIPGEKDGRIFLAGVEYFL
ncbi:MAG: phosphoribosylformylglycinamidine synthase [Firmicutes bacterium]|nr:phosphoribosylformylglycinamidine synthase [Bacillota bacterium]